MADGSNFSSVPYGMKTQRPPAVKEVHVIWMTTGLSCDGDSVSITAASQPSVMRIGNALVQITSQQNSENIVYLRTFR